MQSLGSFLQDIVGKIILALILVPVIWLASCAALAGGTAAAINGVAKSEFAGKASKRYTDQQRQRRNDEWNRESTYRQYDYEYEERSD